MEDSKVRYTVLTSSDGLRWRNVGSYTSRDEALKEQSRFQKMYARSQVQWPWYLRHKNVKVRKEVFRMWNGSPRMVWVAVPG